MKKDIYIYPAIFEKAAEGGFIVRFPDLDGCWTEGETEAEAYSNAQEALEMWLDVKLEDYEELPDPSKIDSLKVCKNCFASFVNVDLMGYRMRYDSRAVNKTVTLPSWLDKIGREHNINFSYLLQDAIKRELNIK